MSEPLTVAELNESLNDLVRWADFALYLPGIRNSDIDIIKMNKRDDIAEQKRTLYDQWLRAHPNASWDDVVKALENSAVRENAIAKQVREKYGLGQVYQENYPSNEQATSTITTPSSSSECAVTPPTTADSHGAVKISEDVVTELDKSHKSFVGLVRNVKKEVRRKVEEGDLITEEIMDHLQEERAFSIPSLESVQTTDELFKAIHPHYHFLNCYLIVSIAIHLLSDIVAQRANAYYEGIDEFMKNVKIRNLKKILKRYHEQRDWLGSRKVEIKVENGWGDQHLWLVKMLVKHLFPVKHPDELPWYDISHGSVIMTFIALEHMTSSLIESSRKKTEFMRLIGVISLNIGDELVWQKEDGDAALPFEDSLIRATLADNIEAVQFILQYTQVDINTRNTNRTLITYNDEVFRESTIESLLKSYYTIFAKLLKNVEYELHQLMEEGTASVDDDTIASIRHPSSNFMNYTALVSISHLLPEHLATRVKKYNGALENFIKKRSALTSLESNLEKYFPTPFPGSIEVIISLHSAWNTYSVWYVEQLGQLIFTPTLFYQLQWFRVDRREKSVRVCLLADGKIMKSLKECVNHNQSRTSMLGVISVQIDDTVMITNDYSDGYAFNNAVELAKAIGNDETSDVLQQMLLSPKEYREVSEVDSNNNLFFSPDPDSTPLMIACCNDNSQLVQLLLDHNADPNIRSRRDSTALIYSTGNSKIFKMLLDHGADIKLTNVFDYTTLHFASWVGNLKVVNIILDKNSELIHSLSNNYRTPFDIACQYRHLEIIERLLQAKADPNVQDNEEMTSLLLASMNGDTEIVETLLRANADPNIKDNEDWTPLYGASRNGHTVIVERLLQAKADPNIQNQDGYTPLLSASCRGNVQIVEALLQAKASPNIKDNEDWTPLYGANRNGHTEIVEKLLLANANPNIQNNKGSTPLKDACHYGNTKIVELLLQAKADPDIQDKEGKTPLISAAHYCRTDIVKKLLKANADPDLPSNDGQTALMVACANSHFETTELLLKAGEADPDLKNKKGQTALDLAMETRNQHFIDRLRQLCTL